MGVRFLGERTKYRLPGLLCGESEEELKVIMECFAEVRRRRGLKVNVG